MIPAIHVERDSEGVKQALVGLFEEAFHRRAIEKSFGRAADVETRQRALDSMEARTLSPGYYAWSEHLLSLSTAIELGVKYSAHELTRSEVVGLQLVRNARNEFEYEYPACSACGERQDNRFAPQCKGCGVKFQRGEQ